MLARRAVNTLILVHRRQLMDQWIAGISSFLQMDSSKIGKIGEGKYNPTKHIDVALLQSLGRNSDWMILSPTTVMSLSMNAITSRQVASKMFSAMQSAVRSGIVRYNRTQGWAPSNYFHAVRAGTVSCQRPQTGRGTPFFTSCRHQKNTFRYDASCSGAQTRHQQTFMPGSVQDAERNQMIFDDVLKVAGKRKIAYCDHREREHLELLAEEIIKIRQATSS